jgi:hypothetical protein
LKWCMRFVLKGDWAALYRGDTAFSLTSSNSIRGLLDFIFFVVAFELFPLSQSNSTKVILISIVYSSAWIISILFNGSVSVIEAIWCLFRRMNKKI